MARRVFRQAPGPERNTRKSRYYAQCDAQRHGEGTRVESTRLRGSLCRPRNIMNGPASPYVTINGKCFTGTLYARILQDALSFERDKIAERILEEMNSAVSEQAKGITPEALGSQSDQSNPADAEDSTGPRSSTFGANTATTHSVAFLRFLQCKLPRSYNSRGRRHSNTCLRPREESVIEP